MTILVIITSQMVDREPLSLAVLCTDTRSKSPVTVQEWVAALPDHAEEEHEKYFNKEGKESDSEESEDEQESDMFSLGAEGNEL